MKYLTYLIIAAGIVCAPLRAHSAGPDPALTNAPGESNCTACHQGTALNGGPGNVRVELVGALTYTPGAKHTVRVTLTDPTASRWGFQLSARLSGTTSKGGDFTLKNPAETRVETANGLQYVSQSQDGTRAGTTASTSWEVDWTAPPAGAGAVTFFAAGNAANRNGQNTGDRIYASSLQVSPGAGGGTETKSYAMPQIAFGGGWSTTLYFTNNGASPANFTVEFYADNGAAMPIPTGGGTASNVPVTVAPGATAQLPVASSGGLTTGWASVKLPTGVSGFGIFKQSVAGREDQEAVVPLIDDSKTGYVVIWDDAGFSTALSVANPEDTPVSVQLTVRNAAGTQLGTGTVQLGPKQKAAFVIRDRLTLPVMSGGRGAVDIRVSSGKVAVLGLRFGPVAFTSIPPAEIQ